MQRLGTYGEVQFAGKRHSLGCACSGKQETAIVWDDWGGVRRENELKLYLEGRLRCR